MSGVNTHFIPSFLIVQKWKRLLYCYYDTKMGACQYKIYPNLQNYLIISNNLSKIGIRKPTNQGIG